MENFRLRTAIAVFGLLLMVVWVMPNVVNVEGKWWPSQRKLNYGLDIQGGLHLVMGVDVETVVGESSARLARVLKSEFDKEAMGASEVTVTNPIIGEITITLASEEARAKVVKHIEDRYPSTLQVLSSDSTKATVRYFDSYLNDYRGKVIEQSIETIRNRIDEFGVAEASISKQGANRILIQLPGMADAEKAKQLINTTAKLDFMLVEDEKAPANLPQLIEDAEKAGGYSVATLKYSEYVDRLNKDLLKKIPDGTMVLFEKSENAATMETGKIPFLVKAQSELTGEALDDAFVTFDQYGVPEVALRFNALGAARFKELTSQSIGRRMAVVLDKVVKTAPSIKVAIGDGNAVITMGGGRNRDKILEESKMIATSLRAGALPASLQQLEERRVGPSLGADSIKKAVVAGLIGALLVVIFMLARYRSMGMLANICIFLNLTSVVALLTSLGATLTLPGIAGMALTVGFAVDANVLIVERMREEMSKGASFALAVKEGYSKAMSAILDANITTAATAFVLLYFGTGPIKGFAVTLLLGILTTMFANVFINKWMVDLLMVKFGVKKLSV